MQLAWGTQAESHRELLSGSESFCEDVIHFSAAEFYCLEPAPWPHQDHQLGAGLPAGRGGASGEALTMGGQWCSPPHAPWQLSVVDIRVPIL